MDPANTNERESLRQYGDAAISTAANLDMSADQLEATAAAMETAQLTDAEVDALRAVGGQVMKSLEQAAAQAQRFAVACRKLADVFIARTPLE